MKQIWQQLSPEEKIASIQEVAGAKHIDDRAVEKDWWVTVVLKALFTTTASDYLMFKGGTSLSKGWNLINRFSEDIDLSIGREFYGNVLGLTCAKVENNNQLKSLRKASRDYIHSKLSSELKTSLETMGIRGFGVRDEIEKNGKALDHDCDPTVIYVDYDSIFPSYTGDIDSKVKIEISCLSMSEPYEIKTISSLIHDRFDDIDGSITSAIKTVTPSRTFLEKAFLLNEEFQKDKPRSRRMSRHLYDLEKIMDTEYGIEALRDTTLYSSIVEHRRKFYHLGYVNYNLNYPDAICFTPQGEYLNAYRKDYNENMIDGYIYGEAISFDELLSRITTLNERFRQIVME